MKNDKLQENLSRPGIIDAQARYLAAARRLRNTAIRKQTDRGGRGSISVQLILDLWQEVLTVGQAAAGCH